MTEKNCPICFGIGWVCRNHPDKAWHDELGCMCSAGRLCQCNQIESRDISEVIIEDVTVH
jgi:hypothetical protein